ncbi:hypothetical protein ZIOFF_062077 [Zingiber officinale]|uniref:Uncharacterized protein n=1 Tax=Zingiber officinale TaxID=94328 RepID=A0A8J5KF26_ZINOF|nr:hypothetical protein ZIOFF_062077 [Zingiber officinale]
MCRLLGDEAETTHLRSLPSTSNHLASSRSTSLIRTQSSQPFAASPGCSTSPRLASSLASRIPRFVFSLPDLLLPILTSFPF